MAIDIYYINLATQPQRRARMETQLATLGLSATRIVASTPAEALEDPRARGRRIFRHLPLTDGEVACAISHLRAMQLLLDSDAPYAAIFEDDAVLSPHLPAFLAAFEAGGIEAGMIKLDSPNDMVRVLAGSPPVIAEIALINVISRRVCNTGYLVSRRGAETVLGWPGILDHPIDEMVYFPEFGLNGRLGVLHAEPALCHQPEHAGGISDSTLMPDRLVRDSQLTGWRQRRYAVYRWYCENFVYGVKKTVRQWRGGGATKRRIGVRMD